MYIPKVIDPDGWMSTTDVAKLMEVPVGRIRHWCRGGVFAPLTRQTNTGRYQAHRALLDEKVWWATIIGRNNSMTWPAVWTGPRMTPRQEIRALRRKSRENNPQEP